MKGKTKLSLLLLVSTIGLANSLSGCTTKLLSDEPSFLKYSNEVTKEQWLEKSDIALNESLFFNQSGSAFSSTVKQSANTSRRQTEKNDKTEKELANATMTSSQNGSMKVDTSHRTMEVKNSKKSSSTNKSLGIYLGDDSTKSSKNRTLQVENCEGKNCIVSVNKDLKVYQVLEEINDSFSFNDKTKNVLMNQFVSFFELRNRILTSYIGLDNSVSKFYIDDTVYTFTYTRDFTTALDDYILKEYRNIVFQFDFANQHVGQFSHTYDTTYTYNSDTSTKKVVYNKSTSYFEGHITLKTQKVKSVNLSSYDRVLEDLE